jgi:hypothetical protein
MRDAFDRVDRLFGIGGGGGMGIGIEEAERFGAPRLAREGLPVDCVAAPSGGPEGRSGRSIFRCHSNGRPRTSRPRAALWTDHFACWNGRRESRLMKILAVQAN